MAVYTDETSWPLAISGSAGRDINPGLTIVTGVKFSSSKDSIINIAGAVIGRDFWKEGRTLESLGIDRLSVEDLLKYVEEGS